MNLTQIFRGKNSLIVLIYINIAIFVLLGAINVIMGLFNLPHDFIFSYLSTPADVQSLVNNFWTPLTYMFVHKDFFHILFNLLALYWFGQMFMTCFSEKQLLGLYVVGGLLGAAFYVAAFNFFPYYHKFLYSSNLMGASGSIMAIIVAAAMRTPNMAIRLLFIGNIKLKFIALAWVLISFFGLTGENGGGQMTHLGGAAAGLLFFWLLTKANVDITMWVSFVLDKITMLFRPQKMHIYKPKNNHQNFRKNFQKNYREPSVSRNFNINKSDHEIEIDRILDKIKSSGYDSLSAEEKRKLFEK